MDAEHRVVDDGSYRQILEDEVELLPAAVWIQGVFAQSSLALVLKSVQGVDRRILMVSSKQMNLARILDLHTETTGTGTENMHTYARRKRKRKKDGHAKRSPISVHRKGQQHFHSFNDPSRPAQPTQIDTRKRRQVDREINRAG